MLKFNQLRAINKQEIDPKQLTIYHAHFFAAKLGELADSQRGERNNIMENYTLKKHLIMSSNFFFFFLSSFLRSLFEQLNHSAMLINISLIEALL